MELVDLDVNGGEYGVSVWIILGNFNLGVLKEKLRKYGIF